MSADQCSTIACLNDKLTALTDVVAGNTAGMDSAWVLSTAFLIFFMQCGFTMLECGSVRAKNVSNIIFKVSLDAVLAILGYWCAPHTSSGENNSFRPVHCRVFFCKNTP